MLPLLRSRAAKAALILCHVELLSTLYHRVCSPAVQQAAAGREEPERTQQQVSTFCHLVNSILEWTLLETAQDIRTCLPSLDDRDRRLFAAASALAASPDALDANSATFVASVCVPSALRCIERGGGRGGRVIVHIAPEHQTKLMQLVVQQARALVALVPLHLAHVALPDLLLCRASILKQQVQQLAENKGIARDSMTTPSLEAVASLCAYLRSSHFLDDDGALAGASSPAGAKPVTVAPCTAWLQDAQRLQRLFAAFTVRVSLLADLGLQASDMPGLTLHSPPFVVEPPPVAHHVSAAAAGAVGKLDAPEFGCALVLPRRSAGAAAASAPIPVAVFDVIPAASTTTAAAQGLNVGVSAADIERISYDAFRVLACLVKSKAERKAVLSKAQPSTTASKPTVVAKPVFSYEAFKSFLSTDFVLLRPVALLLAKAAAASAAVAPASQPQPTSASPVVAVPVTVVAASPVAATAVQPAVAVPAMNAVASASSSSSDDFAHRAAEQKQSGDFLLALMDG